MRTNKQQTPYKNKQKLVQHAARQWFNIVLAQVKYEQSIGLKDLPGAICTNTGENINRYSFELLT